MRFLAPCLVLLLLLLPCRAAHASERPLRIHAAASLTAAMQDIAAEWQALGHPAPVLVFGGSAALARQIDAGAPSDVYASADVRWMDDLAQRGRIAPGTRTDLLGNTLVLVAPRGRATAVSLQPGRELAAAIPGRWCIGDPDSVPAGRYAREALQRLGAWNALQGRLVFTDDVRAALVFVERGECAAGVVYATDARTSRRAEVLARMPHAMHPAIVYPFAATRPASPQARHFLAFLRGPRATAIFRRHGFVTRAH